MPTTAHGVTADDHARIELNVFVHLTLGGSDDDADLDTQIETKDKLVASVSDSDAGLGSSRDR